MGEMNKLMVEEQGSRSKLKSPLRSFLAEVKREPGRQLRRGEIPQQSVILKKAIIKETHACTQKN
jgi:hypothetical protein